MITLHHLEHSRSQRILWMLEELGLPYEIKHYARNKKTRLAPPELKAVHPLGKSPVISDGEVTIAESGAIIDYLAQTYGDRLFDFETGTAEKRAATYWMHYAEGSLMPPLLIRLVFEVVKSSPMPFFIRPVAKGIADKVMSSFVGPNIEGNLAFIDAELAGKQWLVGEKLSLADFQMSFPLEASVSRGVVAPRYKNIIDYVQRYQARPAYQQALKKGGAYDYVAG